MYEYWHIYVRLPTYENSRDEKSTDPFCHISLTLASSLSLLFPFLFSLSLSPLLSLYFISFSVISHEPGIAGNSVSVEDFRQLSLISLGGFESGIAGNSVSDKNLHCFTSSFLLTIGYEPSIAGNSVSGEDLRHLSLIFLGGVESSIAGNSVSDKNLSYSITLLSLSLPKLSLVFFEDSDPGIAGNSVSDRSLSYSITLLSLSLPQLSLVFFEDSDPGIAGNSVSDRNLRCSTSSFLLIVGYEPDIAGNSVSGEDFRQLSLIFLGGFESGIAVNSVSDKNLPYSITLLSLSLPRSGKGPCIMHTSKKMQWEVGSRYITPIQPYRFCRQLDSCYQIRLCFTIQLNCEDVLVVIWFPCWGPVWSMGWDVIFFFFVNFINCLV